MVKAILNGHVLAESDHTVVVENNHYFPPNTISKILTKDSSTTTFCPWKGTAQYFNASVDGEVVDDIAWYYAEPKEAAASIKDHVAFYKNKVKILV